ncbi:hypothetical protein WMZ97_03785 [Lentibacillus sp. N15]
MVSEYFYGEKILEPKTGYKQMKNFSADLEEERGDKQVGKMLIHIITD